MSEKIFITGGAGRIGSMLREKLAQNPNYKITSIDINPMQRFSPHEELLTVNILDQNELKLLMTDCDVVIHLAAITREASYEKIAKTNLEGTIRIFQAAKAMNVSRVIFASSIHVVGFYPKQKKVTAQMPIRPDTLYGVSKAFGEAIGRLYADKYGMSVICIRIGWFRETITGKHELDYQSLSGQDMVELFENAITASDVNFKIMYGFSSPFLRKVSRILKMFGLRPLFRNYVSAAQPIQSKFPCHGEAFCDLEVEI